MEAGVGAFLVAYLLFATAGPVIVVLVVTFVAAGIGIGCAETAEHAAVAAPAPEHLRGPAFGAGLEPFGSVCFMYFGDDAEACSTQPGRARLRYPTTSHAAPSTRTTRTGAAC